MAFRYDKSIDDEDEKYESYPKLETGDWSCTEIGGLYDNEGGGP